MFVVVVVCCDTFFAVPTLMFFFAAFVFTIVGLLMFFSCLCVLQNFCFLPCLLVSGNVVSCHVFLCCEILFRVMSFLYVVKFCFVWCLCVLRFVSCDVFVCREILFRVVSLCVAKYCFVSCLCVS